MQYNSMQGLHIFSKKHVTYKTSNHMLTSISGLIPSPLMSPSSTCHPEGISTETIGGDFLGALSKAFKATSLWMRSSKGGLGVPAFMNHFRKLKHQYLIKESINSSWR